MASLCGVCNPKGESYGLRPGLRWGKLVQLTARSSCATEVELTTEKVTFGRMPCCTVRFPLEHVSAHHCQLTASVLVKSVYLKDTSSNGVLVNGNRIPKAQTLLLKSGDVIHFASGSAQDLAYRLCVYENWFPGEHQEDRRTDRTLAYDIGLPGRSYSDSTDSAVQGASTARKRKREESALPGSSSSKNLRSESSQSSDAGRGGKVSALAEPVKDKIGESLQCCICYEIIHDCVSAQPCLHSYCAGCLADWMTQNQTCPQCRRNIASVGRNSLVNSIIESYLLAHPDKNRSDAELKKLEAMSKTHTFEALVLSTSGDEEYDIDASDPDFVHEISSDDDEDDDLQTSSLDESLELASPETASPVGNADLACCCCLVSFPDRRSSSAGAQPTVQCSLCKAFFCSLERRCLRPSCLGCLNKFRDLRFADSSLLSAFKGNPYEVEVLRSYLQSKSMSTSDLQVACIRRWLAGEIQVTSVQATFNADTICCYRCGVRVFGEMVYQYRARIPRTELPHNVVSRPDCYWGQLCRTQKHNLAHSMKFNHICEQTRFTTSSAASSRSPPATASS